ncbi:nucleotide exchange factor GrpE [Actinoplanes sp. NPDC051633]|uniref:nucleotide exchange factor GrpE n=1 Tax=Actinoplanes sp. NPDC051633 TaxID=3155670 RepID=UPI00342817C6
MADDNPDYPVDQILTEVRELRAAFDAKIRYDEGREHTVATMAEELDRHRHGAFQAQLRTVLVDLITLYDDLSQMISAPGYPPETADRLLVVRDTVTYVLARQGAEIAISENDSVDRVQHKVVAIVKTHDEGADRRIAERLRPGFRWNDRVLRPEWVNAYRYESPPPQTHPVPEQPHAAESETVLVDSNLLESRSGGVAGEERLDA